MENKIRAMQYNTFNTKQNETRKMDGIKERNEDFCAINSQPSQNLKKRNQSMIPTMDVGGFKN